MADNKPTLDAFGILGRCFPRTRAGSRPYGRGDCRTVLKPVLRLGPAFLTVALLPPMAARVPAAEWHAAPHGKPGAAGTLQSPWDLESALAGKQKIAPGDTLWLAAGTYKHPDRKLGSPGYVVRLAGQESNPIHVRGVPGQRVTIDGGLTVQAPSNAIWIRDLEILVSENATMPRWVDEPGSHPKGYNRPWGGLNVQAGKASKFINLVVHDNAQGISWWSGSTDGEVHGCIIYDNGWKAPDRGHGHAIYTQNEKGVKTISDCIMTGGYSYTMHAYGSSRAYVDNYLVEGNVAYNAGTFLIGGGRPSRNIHVLENFLYGVNMQIGYSAPENEDCEVRNNVILDGGLSIKNYKKAVNEGNLVIGRNQPRRSAGRARLEIRPNRYDPQRAHVIVLNWPKKSEVELPSTPVLKSGAAYRLMDPRDFYGKPVLAGSYTGKPIRVPIDGEFAAWVLLVDSAHGKLAPSFHYPSETR